jgi:hypothetical protein
LLLDVIEEMLATAVKFRSTYAHGS